MTNESVKSHTFLDSLKEIHEITNKQEKIKIRELFACLSGRGYAALLIVLSFPFCFPLQIPGFSTPFGLLLSFLGLRIAFAKRLWWPQWALDKEFSSHSISKIVSRMIHFFNGNKGFVRPRLTFLSQNPILHRINGILVAVLGLFLALPLPIPFTNLLSAIPILCIGLGLLEDDGLFILIAYFIAALCFATFIGLFFYGKSFF